MLTDERPAGTEEPQVAEPTPATDDATGAVQQPEQAATAVNWDDEANPHLTKAKRLELELTGAKGAAKQQAEYNRQLRAQMDALQSQWQAAQEQQRQEAARASQQQLAQMVDGDPEDLQRAIRERLAAQKAREEWEATALPQYQRQAQEIARQQYSQFVLETAGEWGLSQADVAAIYQEHGLDFGAFRKALAAKVRTKHVEEAKAETAKEMAALKAEMAELRKASQTQSLAREHASERSPDTGSGTPASGDEASFMARFANGELNSPADYKRAKAALGL